MTIQLNVGVIFVLDDMEDLAVRLWASLSIANIVLYFALWNGALDAAWQRFLQVA